jgi:hypothetical protein
MSNVFEQKGEGTVFAFYLDNPQSASLSGELKWVDKNPASEKVGGVRQPRSR